MLIFLYPKIRRGPKLEGCAFANFGNSSGTEGESRHEINWKIGVNKLLLSDGSLQGVAYLSNQPLRGRDGLRICFLQAFYS